MGLAIGIGVALGLKEGGGVSSYRHFVTRAQMPNGYNSGNTAGNSCAQGFFARSTIPSGTLVKLEFPNWFVTGSTGVYAGSGGAMTLSSLAFKNSGGSSIADFVSGSLVAASGDNVVVFMRTTAQINAGDRIVISCTQTNAGGLIYWGPTANPALGDAVVTNYAYGPMIIAAQGVTADAWMLIGTSRTFGVNDTVDGSGDMGCVARSIGPSAAYLNAGSASYKAADFVANSGKLQALAGYFTGVIFELGVNDNLTGLSTVLNAVYSVSAFASLRKYAVTISPYTTGAWTVPSGSDQTVGANFATVNTYILTAPAPLLGAFDIAAAVSISGTPTKWKAPGYTTDGIHESQLANLQIQASGAISLYTLLVSGIPYPVGVKSTAHEGWTPGITGTTPWAWVLHSGAIPAGMSLNAATGAVTGTPSAKETVTFRLKATDSAGKVGLSDLKKIEVLNDNILVNPRNLSAWTVTNLTFTEGQAGPTGNSAEKLVPTVTSAQHGVSKSVSKVTSIKTYKATVILKAAGYELGVFIFNTAFNQQAFIYIDPATGAPSSGSGWTDTGSYANEDAGNGFFKSQFQFTTDNSNSIFVNPLIYDVLSNTYAGDLTSAAIFDGFYIETIA